MRGKRFKMGNKKYFGEKQAISNTVQLLVFTGKIVNAGEIRLGRGQPICCQYLRTLWSHVHYLSQFHFSQKQNIILWEEILMSFAQSECSCSREDRLSFHQPENGKMFVWQYSATKSFNNLSQLGTQRDFKMCADVIAHIHHPRLITRIHCRLDTCRLTSQVWIRAPDSM